MHYWILLVDHSAKQYNRLHGSFIDVLAEAGTLFESVPQSNEMLLADVRNSYSHTFNYTPLTLCSVDALNMYILCPPTHVDTIDKTELDLLLPFVELGQRICLHINTAHLSYLRNLKKGDRVFVKLNRFHQLLPAKIRWVGVYDRPRPFQVAPPLGTHFGVEFESSLKNYTSCDGYTCDVQYFIPSKSHVTSLFISSENIHFDSKKTSQFYCFNDYMSRDVVHVQSPRREIKESSYKFTDFDDLPDLNLPCASNTVTQEALLAPKLIDDTDVTVGERVVWIDAYSTPQYGTVKWTGLLPYAPHNKMVYVGVEFDNPIGGGTGVYQDRELFRSKKNHASLVPVLGLVRAKDYHQGKSKRSDETELMNGAAPCNPAIKQPKLIIRPQSNDNLNGFDFEIGSCIQVDLPGDIKRNGVVRWMGKLPLIDGNRQIIVGVETESMLPHNWPEQTDGGYIDGVRYFDCPMRYGLYVPVQYIKTDPRFKTNKILQRFGSLDSGVLPDYSPPPSNPSLGSIVGKSKGIQGHRNSCYLDATIYAMFAFNDAFDQILLNRIYPKAEQNELVKLLATRIVFPLRRKHYVRADHIMSFRELLSNLLPNVEGLLDQEKDPEELIFGLFNILNVVPAVKYMCLSGQQSSEHMCSLIVSDSGMEANVVLPSLQYLIERNMFYSNLRFHETPPHLIFQLPRSGRDKLYDYIVPNLQIDIRHILLNVSRPCTRCGNVAVFECHECMLTNTQKLSNATFCVNCFNEFHLVNLPKETNDHMPTPLMVNSSTVTSPVVYDLMSIVCIESSHYVAYSRIGDTEQFVFTDSMADRKGEQEGYNIPQVQLVPEASHWLSENGISKMKNMSSTQFESKLDPLLKRLLKDCYFCFYKIRKS